MHWTGRKDKGSPALGRGNGINLSLPIPVPAAFKLSLSPSGSPPFSQQRCSTPIPPWQTFLLPYLPAFQIPKSSSSSACLLYLPEASYPFLLGPRFLLSRVFLPATSAATWIVPRHLGLAHFTCSGIPLNAGSTPPIWKDEKKKSICREKVTSPKSQIWERSGHVAPPPKCSAAGSSFAA